ncbi:MAG: Imm27 family immunity protein [Sulfobacillus sp.]
MMNINPSETVLTGQWLIQGGRPVADDVCKRIIALTTSHLREIGRDASGWNTLYRDPNDGRYWELSYPQGELHGGGPPALRHLTVEQARQKYGAQLVKS